MLGFRAFSRDGCFPGAVGGSKRVRVRARERPGKALHQRPAWGPRSSVAVSPPQGSVPTRSGQALQRLLQDSQVPVAGHRILTGKHPTPGPQSTMVTLVRPPGFNPTCLCVRGVGAPSEKPSRAHSVQDVLLIGRCFLLC